MSLSIFTDVVPCGSLGGYVHPQASKLISNFIHLVDKAVLELVALLEFFDVFSDESLVEFDIVIG